MCCTSGYVPMHVFSCANPWKNRELHRFREAVLQLEVPFVTCRNLENDTMCQFGTCTAGQIPDSACPDLGRLGGFAPPAAELGLDRSFVDEHDGNVVLYSIDAVTVGALQGFGRLPVFQRLLAGGTNEDVEEIFGEHDSSIVRQCCHEKVGREPLGFGVAQRFRAAMLVWCPEIHGQRRMSQSRSGCVTAAAKAAGFKGLSTARPKPRPFKSLRDYVANLRDTTLVLFFSFP
jgi:hypothetical protein